VSIEQVVGGVTVERATKALRDCLRRDVDLDIHLHVIRMANDLVAGWHLNL